MRTFDEWVKDAIFTQQFRTHYEWMRLAWDAALAAANERIRELEENLGHSEMAADAEAKEVDRLNAKLAAERAVSDRLLVALRQIVWQRPLNRSASDVVSMIEAAAIKAIVEVEAMRKGKPE